MNRPSNDLKQLSRLMFVGMLLLVSIVAAIGLRTFFLDPTTRLLLLTLGSIPPGLFVLSHALLELSQPFRVVRRPVLLMSLLSLCLLYLPTVFIIARHVVLPVDWINAGTVVAVALFALLLAPALRPVADLIPDPTGLVPLIANVAEHLRAVMWDFQLEGSSVLDRESLPGHRESALIDRDALVVFQRTLTTPERDGLVALDLVGRRLPPAISILDIGGGDGAFTKHLFGGLLSAGKTIDSITVVDPADWEVRYRSQFESGTNPPRIVYRRQRFSDYDTTERFDLVLASHSFYGECNVPGAERLDRLRQVLLRFLAYRAPAHGVGLVALASNHGRSYEFKRHALERVFGEPITDLVAEDLDGLVTTLSLPHESRTVDNVIRLEDLLAQWTSGSSERLAEWLEYFLRIPALQRSLRLDVWLDLVEMLLNHAQTFASLPEAERSTYATLTSILLSSNDRVLAHKTRIWAFPT